MPPLKSVLLRGLFAVLPLIVSIALIYWLLSTGENMIGGVIQWLLPAIYFPGLGLMIALLLVIVVGMLLQGIVARKLWNSIEHQLKRIPLLKTFYGSVQDLLSLFSGSKKKDFNKTVIVEWGGRRFLGFVTRETFDDLPEGFAQEGDVAVYLPMSYQLGGFTILVPRDDVTPIDMTMEAAMKFAITAGVTADSDPDQDELHNIKV